LLQRLVNNGAQFKSLRVRLLGANIAKFGRQERLPIYSALWYILW